MSKKSHSTQANSPISKSALFFLVPPYLSCIGIVKSLSTVTVSSFNIEKFPGSVESGSCEAFCLEKALDENRDESP